MRQPYETLLGQFRDHWVLAPYLQGEVPDWHKLFRDSENLVPELDSLSSGEVTLLWIALALWNGNPTARFADLRKLDQSNRMLVAAAVAQ